VPEGNDRGFRAGEAIEIASYTATGSNYAGGTLTLGATTSI
jgi:hypothetical protein